MERNFEVNTTTEADCKASVRQILTWNVVDATVDDHSSLLDPLSFHHLCFPHADNQDVCFAHLDKNSDKSKNLGRHDVIVCATRWQQVSVIASMLFTEFQWSHYMLCLHWCGSTYRQM